MGDAETVILACYKDDAPGHDDHDYLWFKTLRRWNASTGAPIPYVGEKDEEDDWPTFGSHVVYQQGSKIRFVNVGGSHSKLALYDVETEAWVEDFEFHGSEDAAAVATYITDKGPIVVAGVANSVCRWDGSTGSMIGTALSGHAAAVTAVAVYKQSSGKAVIV